MAVIFIVSGVGKLTNVDWAKKYMEAYGVPGYLYCPAAAFEIGSGMALLAGWHTREVGMLLAAWCLLTAAIFHRDVKDARQQINFMKNVGMSGGFLILADHGRCRVCPRVVVHSFLSVDRRPVYVFSSSAPSRRTV